MVPKTILNYNIFKKYFIDNLIFKKNFLTIFFFFIQCLKLLLNDYLRIINFGY